uniref:Uncharacterized protein n=1 Tax=Oryza punctata TaxID=4537 RepID=A0A0E0KH37_ORYPU
MHPTSLLPLLSPVEPSRASRQRKNLIFHSIASDGYSSCNLRFEDYSKSTTKSDLRRPKKDCNLAPYAVGLTFYGVTVAIIIKSTREYMEK